MAFNINPGKQQFSATASQTVFTFNFAIFADTDLKVYKTLAGAVADDTADLLTLSTHYTVLINGTLGGTVTLLSGASLNDTITIARSLPITRTTDYVTNGDLYADTLDLDQDYQTYLVLDQAVQLERAIVVPVSAGSIDLNIPTPEANSYLRWNATADALENDTTIPDDVVTSTAQATIATTQAGIATTKANEAAVSAALAAASALNVSPVEDQIVASTAKATPIDADLLGLVDSAASNVLKKLSWLNAKATLKTYFDTLYRSSSFPIPKGVRQTVQSGSVDANGYANFLGTSASLVMPISATTTPLAISASGGSIDNDRWGKVVADTTLTLPASSTSYIMATIDTVGATTFSSVTLAPIYQFGGTPSVTNNQYTFNIAEMKMYLGNGSTASQVWAVCIGEAVTSGTAVTSVVSYALNGIYDSGWTATLPSPSTDVSKNSNLGIRAFNYRVIIEVTTAEHGFSIGDTVEVMAHDGTSASVLPITVTPKTISFFTAATNGLRMMSKTTKGYVALTLANYKYKVIAQRGW